MLLGCGHMHGFDDQVCGALLGFGSIGHVSTIFCTQANHLCLPLRIESYLIQAEYSTRSPDWDQTRSWVAALLRVAEQRGLEGVVRKRRDRPYRSGECRGRKVKTETWRANRERWRLFEQGWLFRTQ